MNLISQTDFYSIGIHDFDKQLSDFRAVSVPIPGCEVKLEFGYVTLADVPISGIGEEFLKEVRERLERGQEFPAKYGKCGSRSERSYRKGVNKSYVSGSDQ